LSVEDISKDLQENLASIIFDIMTFTTFDVI